MRYHCRACGSALHGELMADGSTRIWPCGRCLAEAAQDAIDGYEDSRAEAALELQAARD